MYSCEYTGAEVVQVTWLLQTRTGRLSKAKEQTFSCRMCHWACKIDFRDTFTDFPLLMSGVYKQAKQQAADCCRSPYFPRKPLTLLTSRNTKWCLMTESDWSVWFGQTENSGILHLRYRESK